MDVTDLTSCIAKACLSAREVSIYYHVLISPATCAASRSSQYAGFALASATLVNSVLRLKAEDGPALAAACNRLKQFTRPDRFHEKAACAATNGQTRLLEDVGQ